MKDLVQGKPWAHPTHPMFVHFPTALYPAALVLDGLSIALDDEAYARSATILIGLGLAAVLPATLTGLVDWAGMVKGSTKRRAATVHLLVQAAAQSAAAGTLLIHLGLWRRLPTVGAVAALCVTTALTFAGNWLGGTLVYRMAMRVGGKPEPSPPSARERSQRSAARGAPVPPA